MKLRRWVGLFLGLGMSVGLLAIAPPVALAAGSYSYDGGSPASCPGSYSIWGSNTLRNPSGATGYVKVELVYCPGWQVAWTRAYNYTSRSKVLLATGIERISSDAAHNKQYDYVKGTCDSFCLDWVNYGARSYGRQVWIPTNFTSLSGAVKATVYYCINSSCSSNQPIDVVGPVTAQTRIANLARLNIGQRACDSPYFTLNGANSCSTAGWCGIFAGWVWANSGVTNTGTLSGAPSSFDAYGTAHSTVHPYARVGDAVVFLQDSLGERVMGHVAIVYWVDKNNWVTAIGGNEGPLPGVVGPVRVFQMAYGSTSTLAGANTYYVREFVSPSL